MPELGGADERVEDRGAGSGATDDSRNRDNGERSRERGRVACKARQRTGVVAKPMKRAAGVLRRR